jgi:hypothetical protein
LAKPRAAALSTGRDLAQLGLVLLLLATSR